MAAAAAAAAVEEDDAPLLGLCSLSSLPLGPSNLTLSAPKPPASLSRALSYPTPPPASPHPRPLYNVRSASEMNGKTATNIS